MAQQKSKKLMEGLEEVEAARQKVMQPSFAATIFYGKPRFDLVMPFPEQSPEDKAIGDALEEKVKKELLIREVLDPEEVERTNKIPGKAFRKAFELGLFGMKVPKEYGGLGLTQTNYNRILALVANDCDAFSLTLSAHQSIGVPQPLLLLTKDLKIREKLTPELIARNEEQKKKYLPLVAKEQISAFALTEQSVGSDVASMEIEAWLNDKETHLVVNGHKLYITNVTVAGVIDVMVRVPLTKKTNESGKTVLAPAKRGDLIAKDEKTGKEKREITTLIVEMNRPGIEVLQRCDFIGSKGLENGLVIFRDVEIPLDNVVGQVGEGLRYALTILNTGRVSINAICLGLARQAWKPTLEWVNFRKTFGKTLGGHQDITMTIATMASTLFAMEAATWLSSQLVDRGNTDVRIEAALTKVFCSEGALEFLRNSQILFGGRGYETSASRRLRNTLEFPGKKFQEPTIPIGTLFLNADLYRIGEGATGVLTPFFAREGLDAHVTKSEPLFNANGFISKIRELIRLTPWYMRWYISNWFGKSTNARNPRVHERLAYVERTSRRLARDIFYVLAANMPDVIREKLAADEVRDAQALIKNIGNAAKDLFMISTTTLYAAYQEEKYGRTEAWDLADQFFRDAEKRFEGNGYFNEIEKNLRIRDDKNYNSKTTAVGRKALAGKYNWLSEGTAARNYNS